jgi:hypothetical protein
VRKWSGDSNLGGPDFKAIAVTTVLDHRVDKVVGTGKDDQADAQKELEEQ